MKHIKILPVLLILSLILPACRMNKKEKISAGTEKIINDSITTPAMADDFSVDVINSDDGLISNNILKAMLDNNNILCLSDKGIIRVNNDTGRINFIFVDNNAGFSSGRLIGNELFLIDKAGLYKFSQNKLTLLFKSENIIPDIIDKEENIYFLTSAGRVYHFKTGSTNIRLLKNFSNIIFQHAYGDDKNILISSGNNLYKLDTKSLSMINILGFSNENINYVLKDNDKYYFGSKTLYEFDIHTGLRTRIINMSSNEYITYLYKENNVLYIGKNKGIISINLVIEPENGKDSLQPNEILAEFAVKDSYINHIFKNENILWISTKNNGIIKYIQNRTEL